MVRTATMIKNMCGNHMPTHTGTVPLAIKVFVNMFADKYIDKTITEGKSLAYLFCLVLIDTLKQQASLKP